MDWLPRFGRTSPPVENSPEEETQGVQGAAPGIAELFEGVDADGSHSVLDLGPATESALRVYSRFARRMRFADLLSAALSPGGWAEAVQALPAQPGHPYDLVLAWNILDHLHAGERDLLVERLVEVTGPRARLHAMTNAVERDTSPPLRFTLLESDRMRYEPTGPPRLAHPPILPAELERLLEPFRVLRGFTLKGGLREYVAVRR